MCRLSIWKFLVAPVLKGSEIYDEQGYRVIVVGFCFLIQQPKEATEGWGIEEVDT